MEEKKIERLYELLERAEREQDTETAAALRWAIFQLESRQGGANPPFSLAIMPYVVYYGYICIIAILGKLQRYKCVYLWQGLTTYSEIITTYRQADPFRLYSLLL